MRGAAPLRLHHPNPDTEARPIFRKIVYAVLVAILAFPIFAGTVKAAGEGDCQTASNYNDWAGVNLLPNSQFTNVRGVRSLISASNRLVFCDGPDSGHGPSYWVSLIPGPGNAYYGGDHAIIQIGVIRCDLLFSQACDGTPNIFYAAGGCNDIRPTAEFLADAPTGAITFAVRRVTGGGYWLTAVQNSVTIAEASISGTARSTSCWASGTGDVTMAQIACERWDPGDNCGATTGTIVFDDIRYQQSVDGAWYTPGSPNAGHPALNDTWCFETHVEMHCDVIAADAFRTWVVQQ